MNDLADAILELIDITADRAERLAGIRRLLAIHAKYVLATCAREMIERAVEVSDLLIPPPR